ncbi:MAG: SpoIIE family protein phosphatase [Bacillota bacterium]|nr:SpoIIE family protein phosphatase [Bacillota bacterium]
MKIINKSAVCLIIATTIICRTTFMDISFAAGPAIIAYALMVNTLNIYLIVPAAVGMITYIPKGPDPIAYIISMIACGLVFAAIRKVRLSLWQRGVIAAACNITTTAIYRFVTGTVYLTDPAMLLTEGGIIIALVYIYNAFYTAVQSAPDRDASSFEASQELSLAAFACIILMAAFGLGLKAILWMVLAFLVLWALSCLDAGSTLVVALVGGLVAAALGEAQWGHMATLLLGAVAASFAKDRGVIIKAAVFISACKAAGTIDSGVVLGIDTVSIILPAIIFTGLYLKFGKKMRRCIMLFSAGRKEGEEELSEYTDSILKDRISLISDMAELYSTYLDSRALLAGQFNVTCQIIENIRQNLGRSGRREAKKDGDKLSVEIAVSQRAATGIINGDCSGWQDIGEGKVAMILSDGMGKGKKAAAESLMVTKTMLGLLKLGVTAELALKTINTIMITKEDDDSYATLDMVIIDKRICKARFYKIGAAPTLIRRKSNVEEVKLSEVPLGIVNGLKIRYVEVSLKKDDRIIMMSDGVSDIGGRIGIKDMVASIKSKAPETMSDILVNKAADSYIGVEKDDMTVMVARII